MDEGGAGGVREPYGLRGGQLAEPGCRPRRQSVDWPGGEGAQPWSQPARCSALAGRPATGTWSAVTARRAAVRSAPGGVNAGGHPGRRRRRALPSRRSRRASAVPGRERRRAAAGGGGLTSVGHGGRVPGGQCLDEGPPAVGEAQPDGEAGGEPAGLAAGVLDSAAEAGGDPVAERGGDGVPGRPGFRRNMITVGVWCRGRVQNVARWVYESRGDILGGTAQPGWQRERG